MAQFECPSMAISEQTKKVLSFSLLALATAVGITFWQNTSAKRAAAERDALLAHFEVISDPFARPKIYRHKSANDFSPFLVQTFHHGEISLVTTSNGQVAFVILHDMSRNVEHQVSILGIKILANDEIFNLRLTLSHFTPDDKFRYHYPPKAWANAPHAETTWQYRNNLILAKLSETVQNDKSDTPYLYRVMEREDEQTLTGDQLKAFKETFRLASLLRE